MLIAIGAKVRLLHTGDVGVVEELLEHDLVAVRLSDGEVIPVIPEALEPVREERVSTVKAKFVPGKKKAEPLPLEPIPVDRQYTVLKPKGLQLAFDPVLGPDENPRSFRMYLINDTNEHFLFQLALQVTKESAWETQGRLGGRSMLEAGALQLQELNNSAVVLLKLWRLLPDGKGTGGQLQKQLKLKPAQFFKKKVTAPYLNRPCHLYLLFSATELQQRSSSVKDQARESLKNYTNRQRPIAESTSWSNLQEIPHEVWAKAAFNNEIDLHIENLVDDPSGMSNAMILRTQLEHFERYVKQAIQVGAERVFVIHGLGEGKLREAIAKRLREMREVKQFKNEFHPRYGYGATEVVL